MPPADRFDALDEFSSETHAPNQAAMSGTSAFDGAGWEAKSLISFGPAITPADHIPAPSTTVAPSLEDLSEGQFDVLRRALWSGDPLHKHVPQLPVLPGQVTKAESAPPSPFVRLARRLREVRLPNVRLPEFRLSAYRRPAAAAIVLILSVIGVSVWAVTRWDQPVNQIPTTAEAVAPRAAMLLSPAGAEAVSRTTPRSVRAPTPPPSRAAAASGSPRPRSEVALKAPPARTRDTSPAPEPLRPVDLAPSPPPRSPAVGSTVVPVSAVAPTISPAPPTAIDERMYGVRDTDVTPPELLYPQHVKSWPSGSDADNLYVEIVVNEKGTVDSVRPWQPPQTIAEAVIVLRALSFAKTWRFHPAEKGGHPVKYRLTVVRSMM